LLEPPSTGYGEVCAGRVGYHHVPSILEVGEHVTLEVVVAVVISRLDVAAPGVMAQSAKGFAHDTATFAGDKDSHDGLLRMMARPMASASAGGTALPTCR
jgi:hypothetical protein